MLYYTPDTLQTYLALDYDEKIDPAQHGGTKADNVVKVLSEFIPQGYSTNLDEYLTRISKSHDFQPHGKLLHVYTRDDTKYEVYKVDVTTCPAFTVYHERLQTFLLWYVDAASFIDVDDDKWTFYLIYENRVHNGKPRYSIVGYTTVYSFYAYPDKIRPRLSQMLILPPFQRKGHGVQLLQAVYDDLVPSLKVLDITIEDPSEEFSALRDFVDCRSALRLSCLQMEDLHKGSEEPVKVLRTKLKLQKNQAVRVYEILRLRATQRTDSEQYQAYRLAVKNRLNGPYQREQKTLVKLQKLVNPLELAMTHPQVSREEHVTQLQQAYEQLEGEYKSVIEKLAGAPEI